MSFTRACVLIFALCVGCGGIHKMPMIVRLEDGPAELQTIGAGALNDSTHLLKSGFRQVTALDAQPIAQAIAQEV